MKICSKTILQRMRKEGVGELTTAEAGRKSMQIIEDYIGKGEEINIQERMIIKGMYQLACMLARKHACLSERDFWR